MFRQELNDLLELPKTGWTGEYIDMKKIIDILKERYSTE
jgi:hypothetical protein